jgi:hypothetical protein
MLICLFATRSWVPSLAGAHVVILARNQFFFGVDLIYKF